MGPRYAIYFAPAAGTALWRFGSTVLGYDAATGSEAQRPEGLLADPALTEEPRRYGFHATLKAPFHLAEGRSVDALVAAARDFAERRGAFTLPRLAVTALGSFVALTPTERSTALHDLADACVEAFEPFRAPLDAADLARRLAAPLTQRQQAYLETHGYPYVFEEFRFHMTLTGSLPEPLRGEAAALLARLYAPIDLPVAINGITLFIQPGRTERFRILERFAFGS